MKGDKVKKFMELAGQSVFDELRDGNENERKLGAQLLLSELLEYIIHGLGVTPEVNGIKIKDPEAVHYHVEEKPHHLEMIDGLADVAYTMYWNANAFGIPLEEAYDLVCDNNLQKFVKLSNWSRGEIELPRAEWECGQNVKWPEEVVKVVTIKVDGEFYGVGKDARGKVRKPSTYKPVNLSALLRV